MAITKVELSTDDLKLILDGLHMLGKKAFDDKMKQLDRVVALDTYIDDFYQEELMNDEAEAKEAWV